jgi:hypothetical protein
VITDAAEYLAWFESPPSSERWEVLFRGYAADTTWSEIVELYPQCRQAVASNQNVPLEVLEWLRSDRDFAIQWTVRSSRVWGHAHPQDTNAVPIDPHERVHYDLTPIERGVLWQGVFQWSGPAHCTEELAVALGFSSVDDLHAEGERIRGAIQDGLAMSHLDWARALAATEVVFISDVFGAGAEWDIVTPYDDAQTLAVIRGLQRQLVVAWMVGNGLGTRPSRMERLS